MFDLKAFREQLGVTQAVMSDAMGMPLRSYQDIEAGKNPIRPIHVCAAKWANIQLSATHAVPLDTDVAEMAKAALGK